MSVVIGIRDGKIQISGSNDQVETCDPTPEAIAQLIMVMIKGHRFHGPVSYSSSIDWPEDSGFTPREGEETAEYLIEEACAIVGETARKRLRQTLLIDDGTESWDTTLGEFLDDNEEDNDLCVVVKAMEPGETKHFGGGATPEFTVEMLTPEVAYERKIRRQERLINRFREFIDCGEDTARRILTDNNWNLSHAVGDAVVDEGYKVE